MTDDDLTKLAETAARDAANGAAPSPAIVSMLRAIAATRSEHERHEMARTAAARLGQAGDVAMQVLKTIFLVIA